jgi:hypothetical protein
MENKQEKRKPGFIRGLTAYLENPSAECMDNLKKLVRDTIIGESWAYYPHKNNIRARYIAYKDIEERIKKLQENDEVEWARLLVCIMKAGTPNHLQALKKLSPFANKPLMSAQYLSGLIKEVELEDQEFVFKKEILLKLANIIIAGRKEFKPDKRSGYLVVLSKKFTDQLKECNNIARKNNKVVKTL